MEGKKERKDGREEGLRQIKKVQKERHLNMVI